MPLPEICQWLNDTRIATLIRESDVVFPVIETVHVLAITLLAGTVAIVDLRLLGLILRRERVSAIAGRILPLTWVGFAAMSASGVLLFLAEAAKSYANPAFRFKMLLLLVAGLNPLLFHFTVYRGVSAWDEAPVAPRRARLTAILSLTLWSAIIVAGRAIAYF
jgi:succinate dehydrogenase hydrophobic anchor subunit